MKVIVFDLGGTLMEYVGMPLSWVDFYRLGFNTIKEYYNCEVTEAMIDESIEILKSFNPRVNYREIEYEPRYIFEKALKNWKVNASIDEIVDIFWKGLKLKAEIYQDTIPFLKELKAKGYVIATLTDLPNGMPDELFMRDINELLQYVDYYGSSSVFGYRKPNPTGLHLIAEKYNIPIEEIIFVGDEEKDRQTALNAGCRFWSVKNGQFYKKDGSRPDFI